MGLRETKFHNVLLLICSIVVALAAGEIATRLFLKDVLDVWDEKNLLYRHDERLGWFPIANSQYRFNGTRPVTVKHNSSGFRDPEQIIKPGHGILFLGDSFVWGYDVEQEERFTDILRHKLPDVPIYNLGVSGYGNDQEYLLLLEQYEHYRPKIVFLLINPENDIDDNSTDMRYGTYFKPYFTVETDSLKLRGVPVPRSFNYFVANHEIMAKSFLLRLVMFNYLKISNPPPENHPNPTVAIIREMEAFVKSKGSQFIVGLESSHAGLEQLFLDEKIPYIQLNNPYVYPGNGNHWTPVGHKTVSARIGDFMVKGGYLQKN